MPQPFSGTPPFEPPRGSAHPAPNPHRPSVQPAEYSPEPYAEPDYEDDYYAYDPDPHTRDRSIVFPIMATVFFIVVLAVGGAIAWQFLNSGKSEDSNVQAGAQLTTTAAIRPGGGANTPPSTSTTKAAPTSVTLPAGATNCTNGQPVSGSFTHSATGSSVTSCGFAEAVRKAYAESAATNVSRSSRSVLATSPVTGRTYTMNCVPDGQLVTCTGGENAVVYVY